VPVSDAGKRYADGVEATLKISHASHLAAAAILSLFLSGCSPSPPSAPDGTYTGTMQDSLSGTGTLTLTVYSMLDALTGSVDITGSWSATFPNGTHISGPVTGTFSAQTLSIILANETSCPRSATLTRSGYTFSGSFAALNCSMPDSGTINVSK